MPPAPAKCSPRCRKAQHAPHPRAQADDVNAGNAFFHLDGKGKPADLQLPAAGVPKTDAARPDAPRSLIVQAESAPDESTASSRGPKFGAAGELTSIKSFADLEREEKEAQAKDKEKK